MTKVDGLSKKLHNMTGINAIVMKDESGYVLIFNTEDSLLTAAEKFADYINLDISHKQPFVKRQDMLNLL